MANSKIKFTHQKLKSIQKKVENNQMDFDGKDRLRFWDKKVGDFGVRVYKSGTMSFFSHYRIHGDSNKKRITHGKFPTLSLSEARQEARRVNNQVAQGIDPKAEEMISKDFKGDNPTTMKELVSHYRSEHMEKNLAESTSSEYDRIIDKYIMPHLGTVHPNDLSPDHVRTVMKKVVDNSSSKNGEIRGHAIPEEFHGNRMANQVKKVLSSIFSNTSFNFDNPARSVDKFNEYERNKNPLDDEQISVFWEALNEEPPVFEVSLKLILLLGQRKKEVAKMEWANIDENERYWTLPEGSVKTDGIHVVPLPPLSFQLVDSMREMNGAGEFVFTSPHGENDGAINKDSYSKRIRKIRERTGLTKSDVRIHDLRSTVYTNLAKMGFPSEIADRVLGHSISSVADKHYDAFQYVPQKRKALSQWEEQVAEIVDIDLDSIRNEQRKKETQQCKVMASRLEGWIEGRDDVGDDTKSELHAQLNTIQSQLESNDPSDVIIEECKKNIRHTLEEEIGKEKADDLIKPS